MGQSKQLQLQKEGMDETVPTQLASCPYRLFANNRPIYANLFTWGCRSLVDFGKRLDVKYSLRLKEPIHYGGLCEVASSIG